MQRQVAESMKARGDGPGQLAVMAKRVELLESEASLLTSQLSKMERVRDTEVSVLDDQLRGACALEARLLKFCNDIDSLKHRESNN